MFIARTKIRRGPLFKKLAKKKEREKKKRETFYFILFAYEPHE